MGRIGVLLVGVALFAASCGAPPGEEAASGTSLPQVLSSESPVDGVTPDLAAACGPVLLQWPVVDLQFEPFDGDIDALVDDAARPEFEASFGRQESIRWSVVERSDTSLLLFGQSSQSATGEPQFGYARFELVDGEWRAAGWGGCRVEVTAEGFGIATFTLDPDNPPDPTKATLHVLATERSCASGQVPVGREVLPVVVETSDAINIVVFVQNPAGNQTCPSNPSFSLTVEIDAPLGERVIRDVALHPGEDRPWPPPTRDSALALRTAGNPPSPGTANVVAWTSKFSGALLFGAAGWTSTPTWFQSFR